MSQQVQGAPVQQPPPQKTAEQLLEQQKQRQQQQRLKEEERKKQEEQARIKKEQDMRKLEEAMKGALSGLGKITDNTSMTNIKLTLAQKQLQRVFPTILKFPHIQHLDLNTNTLTDITILTEFPNLLTLNLSKNQIPDLAAFNVQNKLSKLQFLNLSGNRIKQLTQIALPSLTKLSLNENQIGGVKDWKGHQGVGILELRKNKLRKLKGIVNMKNLTQLYVCQNQLTDIRGLQNLNSLKKLSVRNNKIKKLMTPFPHLPSLTHLNLRQNQIGSIKELAKIDQHVSSVNILANPVTDQLGQNLKKQIIWQMPHFVKINKSPVTEQERIGFQKERLEKIAQEERERLEKIAQEEEARKAAEQAPPQ